MKKDFEKIYQEYANTVKRFLICITNDFDLSEDLTQETFYQAYKSMDRYNGSCKFSVWLCQIAKHLYFDYLKKQKHRSTLDIEQTQKIQTKHAIYDIEEDFIRVEEIQMLLRVVDTTKEPYRKILLLRLFDELCFNEIG